MRYLICAFVLYIINTVYNCNAQSHFQSSHHIFHQQLINPAYIGLSNDMEVFANYRNQWSKLTSEALANEAFTFKYPLYKLNSNVGLHVLNDRIGLLRSTYVGIDYAYNIKTAKGDFILGLTGGFIQSKLAGGELRAPEGSYEGGVVVHNDGILPDAEVSGIAPDLSLGLFYRNKAFRAGVSVNQLLNSTISITDANANVAINYSRSIVSYFEYKFYVGKNFSLQPAYILKTDLVNTQTDIIAMMGYRDKFFGGIGYRGYNKSSNDAVIVLIGMELPRRVRFNYSYDVSVSSLNGFNNGSHEISLSYNLRVRDNTIKRGKIIYNPRFL